MFEAFASRSMARKRPSGITSVISSTVLSTCVTLSGGSRVTYRAYMAASFYVMFNRVASTNRLSSTRVGGVVESTVVRVNCSGPRLGFSNRGYRVMGGLRRRSTSVGRNISHKSRRANTKSRNVVFNFTAGRARSLVPFPVSLTHGLAGRLAELERDKRVPCLEPSNGTRISIGCSGRKGMISLSTMMLSARRSRAVSRGRRRLGRSVHRGLFGAIVPRRLVARGAGRRVGPAKGFRVNNPRKSTKLANHGVVISACKKCTHRNKKTFSNGSYAGMSEDTYCVTECVTGGVITDKLTRGYRVRLSCTVKITRPASMVMSAFKAKTSVNSLAFRRVMHRGFELAPSKVVRALHLESAGCGPATGCNRFNLRRNHP